MVGVDEESQLKPIQVSNSHFRVGREEIILSLTISGVNFNQRDIRASALTTHGEPYHKGEFEW